MTIAENLNRIIDAKEAIKDAIVSKGGQVTADAKIDEIPAAIEALPSGGEPLNKLTLTKYNEASSSYIDLGFHCMKLKNAKIQVDDGDIVTLGKDEYGWTLENNNRRYGFTKNIVLTFDDYSVNNINTKIASTTYRITGNNIIINGYINSLNIDNIFTSTVSAQLMYCGNLTISTSSFKNAFTNLAFNNSSVLNIVNDNLPKYCYAAFDSNTYIKDTSLINIKEIYEDSACKTMFRYSSVEIPPIFSATTLTNNCYQNMFQQCKSLTKAPDLPATKLTQYCYDNMFKECTSLTKAPDLPATTMTSYCYQYMFSGCTSLIEAPDLPATKLTSSCYNYMFYNCTALQKTGNIAASGTISSTATYMFSGCKNLKEMTWTATTPPTINTNIWTNCPTDMIIYVPDASVDAYKAASVWSSRANYIKGISEKPTE